MSALAATVSPSLATRRGVGAGLWLRSLLSLLAAATILAAALPVAFGRDAAGGTGADPIQVFSSGSLLAVDANGGARLSTVGLTPGESRTAVVRVANSGASLASLGLATRVSDRVGAGGAALSGALLLRIESAAGTVYSGPIGQMPQLGLGGFPAGVARSFRFTVTLPSDTGNEVAGASLSAEFAWGTA